MSDVPGLPPMNKSASDDEFFAQLMGLIVKERQTDALDLLQTATNKLKILHQIALGHTRNLDLAQARELARDLAQDLARDRALARARGLDRADALSYSLELARELDLEVTMARDLARDLARALDSADDLVRARDFALALENGLHLALELARDLARTLARTRDINRATELARILALEKTHTRIKFIVEALDHELINRDVCVLEGVDELTLQVLADDIVPYLQALADLQSVIADLKQEAVPPITINSIAQHSTVSINVDGIGDAINVAKDTLVPWRHQQEANTADLAKAQTQFAQGIIQCFSPDLSASEHQSYLSRLEDPLICLMTSRLEIC